MPASIDELLVRADPSERLLVERYSQKLLQVARRKLPERFRGRVDPEDIVQSVYRSFFKRLRQDEFSFADSLDIWRLLIVMTLHKVDNTIKFHMRDRRDVRREQAASESGVERQLPQNVEPGPEDLAILCELLEQLLAELPPAYREIVTLRLQGHSTEEIADKVALSQRTVQRVLGNVQASASKRWGIVT
jgi:RNA polymerase sigma-70 factor, ECF subfamily